MTNVSVTQWTINKNIIEKWQSELEQKCLETKFIRAWNIDSAFERLTGIMRNAVFLISDW